MENKTYQHKVNDYVCYIHETRQKAGFTPTKLTRSMPTLTLEGYFPIFPKSKGECNITFHHIRNTTLHIDHDEIELTLIDEMYKLREAIERDKPAQVTIGSSSLSLTVEEAKDLFSCMLEYLKQFKEAIKEKEKFLCTAKFASSTRLPYAVRLMKVERGLWKSMLELSKLLDHRHGKSDLHVFDSYDAMLKIPYAWKREEYKRGFYALLLPEEEKEFVRVRGQDNNYIWLIWHPLNIFQNGYCSDGIQFNSLATYRWLCYEYIPHVIYYKKKRKDPELSYQEFIEQFDIDHYIHT